MAGEAAAVADSQASLVPAGRLGAVSPGLAAYGIARCRIGDTAPCQPCDALGSAALWYT